MQTYVSRSVIPAVLLAVAAVGMAYGPVQAAELHYTGVLTELSSSYERDYGESDQHGVDYVSHAAITAADPEHVDIDFSQLGQTTLEFTWKAPPGKRIEIHTPPFDIDSTDSDDRTLPGIVRFQLAPNDSYVSIAFSDGHASYAFTDLEQVRGDLTDALNGRSIAIAQKSLVPTEDRILFANFGLRYPYNGGTLFRFSSLTLSTTVPADFDEVVSDDATFGIFGSRRYDTDFFAEAPHPHQWIYLVPEPTSLALLGLGGLMLLTHPQRLNP